MTEAMQIVIDPLTAAAAFKGAGAGLWERLPVQGADGATRYA